MPRTAKSKPTPVQNTISIQDAVNQLGTNEQDLRLALIDIRPDDFDTVKALPRQDFDAVAKKIETSIQPQLPAHSENLESPETPMVQASQTATEKPQNTLYVPRPPQQQITNPSQCPIPNTGLSLVEQLAKQASEEIAAVDAISQVKNQLIINNLAIRQSELTEAINQNWQYQKQEYLGAIRDLTSLRKQPVEVTPDETNLHQEIDEIINELGKNLIV
ncbi:hypothetical protein H6G74_16870 [Nostoc spongiaeforme FACHB-130]|uniref:Uncharacterized protein n=1 Tax=Nostoc spongiaeforme FACHB-130 TaxID=1357510 RepID=A0ABR8FX74_9NOSO|nr:hypothetical protein [Nostoc spongiaeforme]MBD2595988.1 hypothetical protein [Nostoc spongiaeforme FACHB-130]